MSHRTTKHPPLSPRPILGLLVLMVMVSVTHLGAQFVESDVTVLTTLTAEASGDSFGWVAETIGDLDGDGAAEYVVGAPFNVDGGPVAGKAYVYSGADGTLITTHPGNAFERFGYGVAGGGDANGDGVADYAIGGPALFAIGTPRVLVVSGADHSVIHQVLDAPGSLFGLDLHFAGDVDADGHDDLIVGAPRGDGRVDLISGRDASTIWSVAGSPGNHLGSAVTGLGDLNGDGVPEQAGGGFGGGQSVGPGDPQQELGEAFVYDGVDGSVLATLRPNGTGGGGFAFFFLHNAGDVDADGLDDVYVGDFFDKVGGRGYVYSGADFERLRLINAENTTDGLGMGRGAGDIDGDGHADLLIGAFLNSEGVFQGGKCYVYSGKNGHVLRTFTSTVNNAQIGFDVVNLGDVNGDGLTDFLLTGVDIAYVVAGTAP